MQETKTYPLWEGPAPLYDPASGPAPSLTPYLCEDTKAGCVVVCPGGGYANRAPHEGEPIARALNAGGLHAVVLNYRVAPYRYPAAFMDAKRAIRMVKHQGAEWGIDPDHVGILGFSAGGHLAAYTATHGEDGDLSAEDPIERLSSKVQALIPCYAVLSFLKDYHGGTRDNLLGPDADLALYAAHDTIEAISPDTPPTFLWHTAEDSAVPVSNSLRFAERLNDFQIPFELHVYPKGHHGIGLGTEFGHAAGWMDNLIAWLKESGF